MLQAANGIAEEGGRCNEGSERVARQSRRSGNSLIGGQNRMAAFRNQGGRQTGIQTMCA